ncbi:hypothetical protein SRABI84_05173 [Peribacillus simplex]|nr:hypothetical protein SRABI84_05173 [Peribacillus simplex]
MPGKTRLIGDARDEAMAANPPDIMKVSIATLLMLIPTNDAPSRLWDIAIIVEPV